MSSWFFQVRKKDLDRCVGGDQGDLDCSVVILSPTPGMDEVQANMGRRPNQILESLIKSGKRSDPDDAAVLLLRSGRHGRLKCGREGHWSKVHRGLPGLS